ncbi:MAG: DUF805 domain-containing protein [Salaquimonas sp.]|nr:DUF805 domain-containing protein [Salaquimonas sp.]
MIDILSANLGDPEHRLTRAGFAATILYAVVFFYSTLFGAAIIMGLANAVVETGLGLAPPENLLLQIMAAVLGFASGAIVVAAGASRLRDIGRSVRWLVPAAMSFAVFVVSETGLLPAPEGMVSASILVVAATVLVLCLLPGSAGTDDRTGLQTGDEMIQAD